MRKIIVASCVAVLVASACSSSSSPTAAATSPQRSPLPAAPTASALSSGYHPHIDPADFVETVDNRYFPLAPGARFVYAVTADGEKQHEVVEVTDQTKVLLGVSCTAVLDTLTQGGKLIEKTTDWYAQDRQGNVWYFGEDTAEYGKDGRVTNREGSWQSGVDGAVPGLLMPAELRVPFAYRQEFYAGHAEDMAWLVSTTEKAKVPFGSFTGAVLTVEWTPLEHDVYSEKLYAPGVGLVKEQDVAGGDEHVELVSVTPT
jgi:hypothetical protein